MRNYKIGVVLILLGAMARAQSNPIPYLTQPLVPATIAPGTGAFTLRVNGTGFAPGAIVRWNGRARTTTFQSSSSLSAKITASDVAQAGTAAISVRNPAPTGWASNVVFFPVRTGSASVITVPDSAFSATGVFTSGDFNNDGKEDIVVRQLSGGIAVYLGKGDGTFQSAKISQPEITFDSLVPGDFNGDGKLDLATSFAYLCNGCGGYPSFIFAIYLGTGDGHFKQAVQLGRRFGFPLVAADFDGDGKLDVLTTGTDYYGEDWYFRVFLGNGNGSVRQAAWMPTDTYMLGVPTVGDFNQDGKLDVALPAMDYYLGDLPQINVLLGNGDGSFQTPTIYTDTFFRGGYAVASADLNGDGKLDLASDAGDVFLGNGDGTFTLDANAGIEGAYMAGIAITDMNADGNLDIVTNGYNYSGSNLVLLGHSDGTFQPLTITGAGTVLNTADFNGDGALDVLTSSGLFLQVP